jgi:hypothetical protein
VRGAGDDHGQLGGIGALGRGVVLKQSADALECFLQVPLRRTGNRDRPPVLEAHVDMKITMGGTRRDRCHVVRVNQLARRKPRLSHVSPQAEVLPDAFRFLISEMLDLEMSLDKLSRIGRSHQMRRRRERVATRPARGQLGCEVQVSSRFGAEDPICGAGERDLQDMARSTAVRRADLTGGSLLLCRVTASAPDQNRRQLDRRSATASPSV